MFLLKKILKYTAYALVFLLSPLFLISIIILRKFIVIRIHSIVTNRIGHFAGNVDNYLHKLSLDEFSHKYYDIAFYQSFICNKFLGKLWKRNLIVFPNIIIFPLYLILKYLSKKNNFFDLHLVKSHFTGADRDIDNHIDEKSPNLKFKDSEINLGQQELLKNFGLKKEDKFICLNVRDSFYLKTTTSEKDISTTIRWSYRDYNVQSFIRAADELTKRGYYVFRMGNIAKDKIQSSNEMIIDYAFSPHRSDFLDIYLLSNCEFCLTTDLGIDLIPFIMRRPIASISNPLCFLKLSSKKFMNIFDHYYCLEKKRYLSINEIFKKNLGFFDSSSELIKCNVKLIQPSEEEIKDLALDMLDNIRKNFQDSLKDTLNREFLKIFDDNCSSKNFINHFSSHPNNINKFEVLKLHNKYYGRISPTFLEKNQYLLVQ